MFWGHLFLYYPQKLFKIFYDYFMVIDDYFMVIDVYVNNYLWSLWLFYNYFMTIDDYL